ncbi:hypothetical protein [Eoetvoesiella caeni]
MSSFCSSHCREEAGKLRLQHVETIGHKCSSIAESAYVNSAHRTQKGKTMKIQKLLIVSALLAAPFSAGADSWKDDGGYGYRDRREIKQEYWEGNCKVKREYKKNGEYKEKRKCKEPEYRYYEREPVYRSGGPAIIIDPVIRIGVDLD